MWFHETPHLISKNELGCSPPRLWWKYASLASAWLLVILSGRVVLINAKRLFSFYTLLNFRLISSVTKEMTALNWLSWEFFGGPKGVTIGATVGIFAGYFIYTWFRSSRVNYIYLEARRCCWFQHINCLNRKVKARLQIQAEQIKQVRELTADLDPKVEEEIAALKIEDLLSVLRTGQYKCVDVLKTYQKRSLRSQEETNCVTEYILVSLYPIILPTLSG